MTSNIRNFALRDKSIVELRSLDAKHDLVDTDLLDGADRSDLIAAITDAASANVRVAHDIQSDDIAIKPSSYLLAIRNSKGGLPSLRTARRELETRLTTVDESGQSNQLAAVREFALHDVAHEPNDTVEIQLTWQRPFTYPA